MSSVEHTAVVTVVRRGQSTLFRMTCECHRWAATGSDQAYLDRRYHSHLRDPAST